MSQIKEKAPAAPASVTSAKPVHIEDTIKNLIRQVEPVNFNLEDCRFVNDVLHIRKTIKNVFR